VAGGATGGFVLLYPIAVLSATVLLQRKGGVLAAIVATMFHGGLYYATRVGIVKTHGFSEIPLMPVRTIIYSVFLTAVACVTIAMIGAYFVQSLSRVGVKLEKATAEVADLREINQKIVDSIQSGLITTDKASVIQYINRYGETIIQEQGERIIGRTLKDVFDAPEFVDSTFAMLIENEKLVRRELFYRRPDGCVIILGASISRLAPITEAGPSGFLMVFQDLTEINRLEEQVKAKERLAAMGEMAAQLAHEIRNPLGSISGAAQVLMNDKNLSNEEEQLLSIIRRESQRLSDKLNEFLLRARPSPAVREVVDLSLVIEEAVTLLRNGLRNGGGHSVSFSKDKGSYLCRVDPAQITQVFWNLARNGIEAMVDGGMLYIALSCSLDEIFLCVKDQGGGIKRKNRNAMFAPFTTGTTRGTGLGLAIVYRIVREHEGDIDVKSGLGEGTEVVVRLPAFTNRGEARQ
jgi:two-component system sensor histidine kinase PilS (NtrC family)